MERTESNFGLQKWRSFDVLEQTSDFSDFSFQDSTDYWWVGYSPFDKGSGETMKISNSQEIKKLQSICIIIEIIKYRLYSIVYTV